MQSPLDMAKRLQRTSLRKIATEVADLNHVPVPQPLSLKELLTLFANVAEPKVPIIVEIYNFGRIDWKDASAGTFRYATLYHAKIQMKSDGEWFRGWDGWTSDMAYVSTNSLPYNTDCRAAVIGWNEWGHSETRWTEFSTGDNPNPPPPPPNPPPPPPHQPQPSAILFYNCDNTPVGETPHLPVIIHLRDLTTNDVWKSWEVAPGYDSSSSGGCGQGVTAPFIIPSDVTGPVTAGHTYQWIVTKPDDPDCSDSSTDPNDPNHCPVLGPGNITIGSDTPLVLQWPPV
jgi:hypothetical protein